MTPAITNKKTEFQNQRQQGIRKQGKDNFN
jgi:hypothetical protein